MMNEENKISHSAFFKHLGFQRTSNDNGNVVISIDIKDQHINESGSVSCGIHYTLLDVALGTSISETMDCSTVTINMHVQIFENRHVKQLTCRGRSMNVAENIGSAIGDIFDENGSHCACGLATFKIKSNKKGV